MVYKLSSRIPCLTGKTKPVSEKKSQTHTDISPMNTSGDHSHTPTKLTNANDDRPASLSTLEHAKWNQAEWYPWSQPAEGLKQNRVCREGLRAGYKENSWELG